MDQATRSEFYKQYRLNHQCCPSCGGTDIHTTTIGYILIDPATYKDCNRASCFCGWDGIVHNLVPEKPLPQQKSAGMTSDVIGGFPCIDPECAGCGEPLKLENAWMTDGCPCNSMLGCNSLNETRWRLLMELQQQQSRKIEALQKELHTIKTQGQPR